MAWIPLAAGVAPIIVVHVCYAISVYAETVPLCLPYVEGCTSISRAARHGLANHVFKAVMLPCAGLMTVFWMMAAAWARELSPTRGRSAAAMRVIGITGALFLVLYAAFLGVDGDFYRWMRRYGVTVYFSFTVLAQMLLASLLTAHAPHAVLRRHLIVLALAMLGLGIASVPLQHVFDARDVAVNAIEWCYALLMSCGFCAVGLHWRRIGLRLRLA